MKFPSGVEGVPLYMNDPVGEKLDKSNGRGCHEWGNQKDGRSHSQCKRKERSCSDKFRPTLYCILEASKIESFFGGRRKLPNESGRTPDIFIGPWKNTLETLMAICAHM